MGTTIQKRQVLINSIMSVTQVIVTGGILLILYRFLLKTIGIEQLGIWSVVLAATSVANIANLGLSGGIVKFVAKYLAKGEEETVVNLMQTAVISMGVFIGLILIIIYPFANLLLSLVIPVANLRQAVSVFPYALFSFWIMIISSVFQAGLDGYQRIDVRSRIFIISALFNLILCFMLVPTYGLMGLAYANITQAIVVLIGSLIMLKQNLPLLPIVPYKWDRKLFKEIVGYGLNFQAISISQMFCDPTTKALLAKFGGLTMVGFYEMASRMVLQFRALLVSANQVLVPSIATLQEVNPNFVQNIYRDNYRLMLYIASPFYAVIIVMTPLISEIWIGHYEPHFVLFTILLAVNLFINTLSVPAYCSYLGIGKLKWNALGHVTTAFMNAISGFIFGYFYGGIGVVVAWIFSSLIGTIMIAVSYHYIYKISLKELFPKESVGVAIACLIATFFALLIYFRINQFVNILIVTGVVFLVFSIIVFPPLWLHPIRKRLTGWIATDLLNKAPAETKVSKC